ncbi:ABC transporter permease subunit [Rhodobacteraceae bacterium 2CG4]|uniref:ABC transporter permease subunit n=1 Tax=Halovulum marinum TaxID=2662447 RepID=A0A6L5YX91_9RHOB|nr:ABC transporter permease [Halovulum marinum]MSU88579.1 ABC transporter permease subunit [Halovulum marinum]
MFKLNPLQRRRWNNFRSNRRAYWSLIIFAVLFVISMAAEIVANDRPIMLSHNGEWMFPALGGTYEEADFGGDPGFVADFTDPVVRCLVIAAGLDGCFDAPDEVIADARDGEVDGQPVRTGWMIWPPIPYSFNTINYDVLTAPSPPDGDHWLGTDDQTRDVTARVIYGFRISVIFALIVTFFSSVVGIFAGAVQGYFGGWLDLTFQRLIEIWQATPALYVIIIMGAIFQMSFALLTFLIVLFSWTALVGVVRAEFLRTRNFEYVRAAKALGVGDGTIMFRHMLPNAMVATITLLPFLVTAAVGTLTGLDFLGFGLPPSYPSLGELALQGKNNLQSPHLGITAFVTLTVLLSLLVFIFEGVRDAFDPRKTFA